MGFSDDQACHFVASQYAHSASRCESGICTELLSIQRAFITQDARLGTSVITCAEASGLMLEFLSEYAPDDMAQKRPRPQVSDGERFAHALEHQVIPALRVVVSGVQADSFELSQTLSRYIGDLRRAAASNPAAFSAEILQPLNTSESLVMFEHAVQELVYMALTTSWLDSEQLDELVAGLYFYFDFSALLGRQLMSSNRVGDARLIIHTRAPGYRGHYTREFRYPGWYLGVPAAPGKLIDLSQAIERFASRPDPADTEAVQHLFAGWDTSVANTAESLVLQQIVATVCPQIERIIPQVSGLPLDRGGLVKLGVTLVDFCSDEVAADRSQAAQEAVVALLHGEAARMQLLNIMDESADVIFFDNDIAWARRLGATNRLPRR